ncbi:MAG: DHH family phosphoesterase [Candidatus Diapherotrites archaeon]
MKSPFSLKGKKILVVTHKGADVDAIASSGILLLALRKKNFVQIGVPEHISKPAEKLAERMEIPFTHEPDFSFFDTLFVADLNSNHMLGCLAEKAREFKGKVFQFDHHSTARDPIRADFRFCNPEAASTTEVLWMTLKRYKKPINEKIAILAACGLLTDSAHFSFAGRNSFRVMFEAMQHVRMPYYELLEFFSVERDFSERIARLKAAHRSRIYRIGKSIVVTSEVGSFEAQAASALVQIGADVAFVATQEDSSLRVSARAKTAFAEEFGIDLARDVFQKLQVFFEGEGGGHATAASFTAKTDSSESLLEKCVSLLLEKMKEQKKKGIEFKEYK